MESRSSNYLIKVAIEIGISSGSQHNKTQIKVMRRLGGRCANIWAHFTSSSWGPSCITWPQVIILHMPTQPQQKHVKWEEAQTKGEEAEDKEEESKGTHRIFCVSSVVAKLFFSLTCFLTRVTQLLRSEYPLCPSLSLSLSVCQKCI